MKFFINNNQVSKNWAESDLVSVVKFLKEATFNFKKESEFTAHKNFIFANYKDDFAYELSLNQIKLKKWLSKEHQPGFICSIIDNMPINDNGYSYVFIDLDLKKMPGLSDDEAKLFTELLFTNYSMPSQDADDYRRGIIFVKMSSSLKGLNLLFRVKGTNVKEDIKAYSIEILRRLNDQVRVNVFAKDGDGKLLVADTSCWGSNRKMFFNLLQPDQYWINDTFEYLELDEKKLRQNINFFGRKGPKYTLPKNNNLDIQSIWKMSGGDNFEEVYKTGGNHNKISTLCFLCNLYSVEQNDLIEWLEKNQPNIIDSNKPYNENETTRAKIKRLWQYTQNIKNKTSITLGASTLFAGNKVDKEVLYNKLKESNLVLVKGYNTIQRKRDFYFNNDNLLTRCCFDQYETLMDSDWFKSFLDENNVSTEVDKAAVLTETERYIFKIGDFRIIDLYNDCLYDTDDKSYLYVDNGILEITANSINLLNSGIYLDSWISREMKGGVKISPIIYDDTLKLEDWKETVFFETCTDYPYKLKQFIGYLAHRYKNTNKIVTLIDGFDIQNALTDDSGSGGGTGKTLASYILKPFRNICEIGSPNTKDQFWLDTLRSEHDILILNEVSAEFNMNEIRNFEDLAVTIKQKGKENSMLIGDSCPRVLMNTNYGIISTEKATLRRILGLPFNNKWQNIDMKKRFGHNWFRDQHSSQWWSYLLLFVIDCIQLYLKDKNLNSALTEDMIVEKNSISKLSNDNNTPYYDMIWNKLMSNGFVFVNDEIVEINREHRKSLNLKKIHDYLRSQVASYSKAKGKPYKLERRKDWKTTKNITELKETTVEFSDLFSPDLPHNRLK